MKLLRRVALGVVVGSFVAAHAFSQGYPMPGKAGDPPVKCPPSYGRCNGTELTWPYELPLSSFKGRFVDSSLTRDYQSTPRTYRARGVRITENGFVYIRLGSTFAAYTVDSFFSKLTPDGSGLARVSASRDGALGEQYLPFNGSIDPQRSGSGWIAPIRDSQDRLYEFDWDTRGYAYLAYSVFGWGIVKQEATGAISSVKQLIYAQGGTIDQSQDAGNSKVMAVESGGKWYALVSATYGTKLGVWDVSTPAAPKFIRIVSQPAGMGEWAKIKTSSGYIVGIGRKNGNFEIYNADTLMIGGSPMATYPPTAVGFLRNGVTTDGTNFYVASGAQSKTGTLSVYKPAGGGWTESVHTLDAGFYPTGAQYSDGYVAMWGWTTASKDLRLARITPTGFENIDLKGFFSKYYVSPPSGYVTPDGYTSDPKDAMVYKYNGKEYLIISNHGMGDVFELQGRDMLSVSSSNAGTKNPWAVNRDKGPYYGDPIQFSVTAPTSTRARLSLDNAEATANYVDATSPFTYTHQYQAVIPANPANPVEISRARSITATAAFDPTNVGMTNLTLLVPGASAGVRSASGGTIFAVQPNASSPAQLAYGDEAVDTSDGRVESHYSLWTLNGVDTANVPNDPLKLNLCGVASLTLAAHYAPYTGVSGAITPTITADKHWVPTVANVGLEVRPFIAELAVPTRTANGVTFTGATKINPLSGAFVAGSATELTVTWKLLPPVGFGETPYLTQTGLVTAGVANDPDNVFALTAADINAGRRIVFEVSLPATAFTTAASSCTTAGYLTSTKIYTLKPADPNIVVSGCDRVGNPCTLTATSLSGDMTGWTNYVWKIDGNLATSGATRTSFNPAFATSKTYSVELIVSNVLGDVSVSKAIFVDQSQCPDPPSNTISFTYAGATTGCRSGCDLVNEALDFNPTAFRYDFQSCDNFEWNFGDGQGLSTEKTPRHKFPGAGPYNVTLKVTNAKGTFSVSNQVIGQSGGGGEEPPTCPALPNPAGKVFGSIRGSVSRCQANGNCFSGEQISFVTEMSVVSGIQNCHSVKWRFSDGTTVNARSANKTFAALGSYTATIEVTHPTNGTSKSQTYSFNVIQGGGDPGCPVNAPNFASVGISANQNGTNCRDAACVRSQPVTVSAFVSNYTTQSCDTLEWNWGDGSALETSSITSRERSHTFTGGAQNYTVTVRVKNSKGQSQPGSVTVRLDGQPAVEPSEVQIIASKERAQVGEPITFSGTARDNGWPITKWEWDFNDGSSKVFGQERTKTFLTAGTYNVTLRAYNAGGDAQAVKTIVVSTDQQYAFLLPVVARLDGQNQTKWRTDLHVYISDPSFNPNVGVDMEFEFQGQKVTKKIDASTLVKEDFLAWILGENATGAGPVRVNVSGQSIPQLWTRTYTVSPSGVGTYGQLIPAVDISTSGNSGVGGEKHLLAGLHDSTVPGAKFRTNLGLVNPTSTVATITANAIDENGAQFGTFTETVDPFQFKQVRVSDKITEVGDGRLFSLSISSDQASLMAYASMVDNISNDPVFQLATPLADLTSDEFETQIVPVGHFNLWRSDVEILNPSTEKALLVDLEYYDSAGTLLSSARNKILVPGALVELSDILWGGFLTPNLDTNSLGTLKVKTTSGADEYPIVFARTYSEQGASGTFGQGIPAFSPQRPNAKVNKPAVIAGVRRNTLYYTNVGIVNVGSSPAEVHVVLLDRTDGHEVGRWQQTRDGLPLPLAPGEAIIATDVIGAMNTTADVGTLRIEVKSGEGVWAYASIIDKTTTDPEYVPAVTLAP